MKRDELIINIALGLSIIGWGILGIRQAFFETYSTVRLFSASLNVFLGCFILFRKPVLKAGSFRSMLISLPSFVLGGLLFKMAHPFENWPLWLECTFVAGVIATTLSFSFLGRNFAIFPSLRAITTAGPYRLVRHPGYASESIMITTCCLANPTAFAILVLLAFFIWLYFRIEQEEQLLSQSEAYTAYQASVRWKLIPLIW